MLLNVHFNYMSEKRTSFYLYSPKVIVSLLVVLSLTSLFYGWNSWKKTFKYGLIYNNAAKIDAQNKQKPLLNDAQATETKVDFTDPKLKVKDTDNDGLTDWDELNVYKTSPYIADSDSDNVNDGEEIKRGSDPLCVEGANCLAPEPVPAKVSDGTDDTLANIPTTTNNIQALENISSVELRQLLIKAGYTEEQLKQLTDEQLNQLWQQALQDLSSKTKK